MPGYRTDVTGLTQDEARALFVLTTGGAHEDLGLGNAARDLVPGGGLRRRAAAVPGVAGGVGGGRRGAVR